MSILQHHSPIILEPIIECYTLLQWKRTITTYGNLSKKVVTELNILLFLTVEGYNILQRRGWILVNYQKKGVFSSLLKQLKNFLLGVVISRTPPNSKDKGLLPHWKLDQKYKCADTLLKEELTDLFWKLAGISYLHRQSKKWMVNVFLIARLHLFIIAMLYFHGLRSHYGRSTLSRKERW